MALTDDERKAAQAAINQLAKVQESRRPEAVAIVALTFGQKLQAAQ